MTQISFSTSARTLENPCHSSPYNVHSQSFITSSLIEIKFTIKNSFIISIQTIPNLSTTKYKCSVGTTLI